MRLYLQEAGTVPLLTAADEVRLAEQLQSAKAHLLEALHTALPTAAIPPELTPESWLAEQLRHLQRWVARLDQGQAAAVRHLWATLQPWQEQLEAAKTAGGKTRRPCPQVVAHLYQRIVASPSHTALF
jgi:Sigma-70 factor, region 1.2